jgi:NADH-quinone oxidoreductase subunit D
MNPVVERSRVGISPLDSARSDQTSNLSLHTPATHGMLRIDCEYDGELITSAKPILGSMHRGAEKLFESRDYRQVLALANRHEWLSAYSGEVGVAQLIETALGIEVPEAAQWFRTLFLEFNRVTSHLAFLAGFPWQDQQLVENLRKSREQWVNHYRIYTGSRMHPMLTRIGGLTQAPTSEWLSEVQHLCFDTAQIVLETNWLAILAEYESVGVLTKSQAIESAVSGPATRASGHAIDLRETASELKYFELESFAVALQTSGDVSARMLQLVDEVTISLAMISELIEPCTSQTSNEVNVLLPKVVRVPEGSYEHSIETPLGIASWFLVSRNDKMPYRLKLRPASLHTVLALATVLPGSNRKDFDAVVASMPFIAGDVDR